MSKNDIYLFEKHKKQLLSAREVAIKKLEAAQKTYDKMLADNGPRKEIKLQYERNKVALHENSLSLIENKLKFLRPGNEEDIAYRVRQNSMFAEKVSPLVPDDIPLRFHGCPIYAAEKIIESGEISSSVDRIGVATSYDGVGQISVTNKESINITIQGYTDLTYDYNLPAGCVFVITPQDRADEKSGEHQLMNGVDFKSNPERLVAVISTPENVPVLQSWLSKNGMESEKAIDFDGFIHSIDKVLSSVCMPYRNIIGKPSLQSSEHKNSPQPKMDLDSLILEAKQISEPQTISTHSLGKNTSIEINR